MGKKAPTPIRNHAVDYFVTVCVFFILVVALGFFYVEDIRVGLSVIVETFLKQFYPDML
jgi:hypothetical protein